MAPTAERAPGAEPERTYVGQHDERPLPTPAVTQAAPPTSCPVDLGDTTEANLAKRSLFSRTLVYLQEYYPRDITPRSRELLLAALSAVGAADGAVGVKRDPEAPPRWITVTVAGEPCTLNIERVDAPWSERSSLQQAMRFIASHLKGAGSEGEMRFTNIEIAATNGMLSALDPGSVLMDVDTYRDVRVQFPGLSAQAGAAPGQTAGKKEDDEGDENIAFLGVGAPPGDAVTYLRPGVFHRGAAAQVERALMSAAGNMPKGIVLDLRDNSGGLLDEAANVADHFIQRGVLGWTVSKHERKALEAHDGDHEFEGAVVVLVNHATTESAELVASAIKDLGRGVVLGEPTAGVGSVRALFEVARTSRADPSSPGSTEEQKIAGGPAAPLPGDEPRPDPMEPSQATRALGLLLRTGYLRTANDNAIEGSGVRPDLRLPWPAGRASSDDCLSRLARAVIDQAEDPGRLTLLATARALANRQACPPAR